MGNKRSLKDFKGSLPDALKAYELDPDMHTGMIVDIASDYYQLGKYKEGINFLALNRPLK